MKKKIYGYMIGYRVHGSRFFHYFTTFTHSSALRLLRHFKSCPQRERTTNKPIIDSVWEIQPITKKEIMEGLMQEIPFPSLRYGLSFVRLGDCRTVKTESKRPCEKLRQFFLFSLTFGNSISPKGKHVLPVRVSPCRTKVKKKRSKGNKNVSRKCLSHFQRLERWRYTSYLSYVSTQKISSIQSND